MSSLLEVKGLECIRGDRVLFRRLSFSLAEGSLLELSGSNGSGKTSLLRILSGLMQPAAGDVRWHGQSIASLKEDYLGEIAYLGHANGLKSQLTVVENLRIASALAGSLPSVAETENALVLMGLRGRETALLGTLSQGQKRRLALVRLLLAGRKLWILDEPLAALDTSAVAMVKTALERHLEAGGLAVLATHQPVNVDSGRTVQLRLAPIRED